MKERGTYLVPTMMAFEDVFQRAQEGILNRAAGSEGDRDPSILS